MLRWISVRSAVQLTPLFNLRDPANLDCRTLHTNRGFCDPSGDLDTIAVAIATQITC
jgi:hypothetical protein